MLHYLQNVNFLPFINNEVDHGYNEMYKNRIENLNSFVAIEFDADTVIFPRSSELFDQMTDY
jgi:hypothetical protein